MLQLKNITKTYPNSERKILDQLSFNISSGDAIAIVGPSGSGKSTLLNIMSTLDAPTNGEVFFESTNLHSLSPDEQADFRNQKMGFVFQQHHLLPQLNLLENVLLPTLQEKNRHKKNEVKEKAHQLIEWVGLSERIKQKPSEMSVGECQRTAVVRALINQPQILFADEPTGSLDQESAHRLVDLFVKLNKTEKLTTIVVTHALEIAEKLDKTFRLIDGKFKM